MNLHSWLARVRRRPLKVWYHEAFRFPLPGTESSNAMEGRRAADALHFLLRSHVLRRDDVYTPDPISYADLGRVHGAAYLESLAHADALATIFAVDACDVVVDELLRSIRLACGATLEAAREALRLHVPTLNLVGGFHHAFPSKGQGFCAVNDLAVAIAALRADGFDGQVAIIDLDAHPPDGTAACLEHDLRVWVGSLSGSDWGPMPRVDETVLPRGCPDEPYLSALDALLARMPPARLAFVLAGGDVMAGDKLGVLGLTLGGVRRRDLKVIDRLKATPQVWLSAGGYGPHAWKVLAGSGMALALHSERPIPPGYDPLGSELALIARLMPVDRLGEQPMITEADLPELFGRSAAQPRLLGFYTREGVEFALERFGILPLLRRTGFSQLRVELGHEGSADRVRLLGRHGDDQAEAVLVEMVAEKKAIAGGNFLFVNWLSLRNPRAHFSDRRPQLPGQEVPGLGLAKEATTMLALMAERLMLDGVAFRPSWYHMAFAARRGARFVDPARQGRFEAMVRDLGPGSLLEATHAAAEGRLRCNGEPYAWEPDEMVRWLEGHLRPDDSAVIAAERERCHFTIVPVAAAPAA